MPRPFERWDARVEAASAPFACSGAWIGVAPVLARRYLPSWPGAVAAASSFATRFSSVSLLNGFSSV
jgi:hypothetical protein